MDGISLLVRQTQDAQGRLLCGNYLLFEGNGGFAGIIDYATMLTNLNDGFAVGGYEGGTSLARNLC
jgi:hypothetical protein